MRSPLCLFCLFSLTFLPLSHASRVQSFNLMDLTNRADKIFTGRCVAVAHEVVLSADGKVEIPAVRYTFEVVTAIDGVSDQTVEVMHLGHFSDGRPFALDPDQVGVPRYRVGGTYLLFVGRKSHNGLCSATGLRQGVFDVVEGRARNRSGNQHILRGFDEILSRAPYRPLAFGKGAAGSAGLPLEVLERLVRDLRAQRLNAPTMREVMQ